MQLHDTNGVMAFLNIVIGSTCKACVGAVLCRNKNCKFVLHSIHIRHISMSIHLGYSKTFKVQLTQTVSQQESVNAPFSKQPQSWQQQGPTMMNSHAK